MLSQLIEQANQFTIVDMEASVEHMSRGTVRHVDQMLVVTEPYYRSLETAARLYPLAQELGIKQVYVVANKVRDSRDEEAIRRYCAEHEMELIAVLPFDEGVLGADQAGRPILEEGPESAYVQEVQRLAARLQASLQKEQVR
jgi:CO dehydrogenase maturation factor